MKHHTHFLQQASGIALRRLSRAATAGLSLALVLAVGTAARAQFDVETKITASDPASADFFGKSVAISGNTAIVGAHGQGDGTAYLFDITTGNRVRLTASDIRPFYSFGTSVAISGNTAIVGALGRDGGARSGSAYLFDLAGNQLHKLIAFDGAPYDEFGLTVAISGDTAIVGSHFDDDACPELWDCDSGSAYLFDVKTGHRLSKLRARDAAAADEFGKSVGISDDVAIVGAVSCPFIGCSDRAAAYLFDVTTGNQLHKLTASDAIAKDEFGESVAISGNVAIVGAWRHEFGAAYLFDVTTGVQLHKLTASDGELGDTFGRSVAISGNTAIVGDSHWGSAYLFDVTTGDQLLKLTSSDNAGDDLFGFSVGISGNAAIVGAKGDDDAGGSSGSAYLFTSPSPLSDLTNNGFVDFEDLTVLLANWNKPGATPAEGNLVDAKGTTVNFEDLTVLLADWTGPGPAASPEAALGAEAVPEPSTLLLAVIATLGLSACRRRRRPPASLPTSCNASRGSGNCLAK